MGCMKSPYAHTSTPANAPGFAAASSDEGVARAAADANALSVSTHSPRVPPVVDVTNSRGRAGAPAPARRIAEASGF